MARIAGIGRIYRFVAGSGIDEIENLGILKPVQRRAGPAVFESKAAGFRPPAYQVVVFVSIIQRNHLFIGFEFGGCNRFGVGELVAVRCVKVDGVEASSITIDTLDGLIQFRIGARRGGAIEWRIFIDLADVPNLGALQISDFGFHSGNTEDPNEWPLVSPNGAALWPGEGDDNSTRVEFTFADGTIVNQWLEVTVKANERTGHPSIV